MKGNVDMDRILPRDEKDNRKDIFRKYDQGKLRYDLLPSNVVKDVVHVLTMGADKYGDWNWTNCKDSNRYIAALYRHVEEWRMGKSKDDESGLSHLSHAICNLVFLAYLEKLEEEDRNGKQTDRLY